MTNREVNRALAHYLADSVNYGSGVKGNLAHTTTNTTQTNSIYNTYAYLHNQLSVELDGA